ncbi:hypothetical protein DXG01_003776 [Tephrocybe rancida]|nr:hypothetical protein DXG01_003776 [Tephrocybe rancida]
MAHTQLLHGPLPSNVEPMMDDVPDGVWPQKLIIQARINPNIHVKTLVNFLRDDIYLNWSLHVDILAVYVSQFDAPPPPISMITSDMAPMHSLVGLWRVLDTVDLDKTCPEHLLQCLSYSWPGMWLWIDRLYFGLIASKHMSGALEPDTRAWLVAAMGGIPSVLLANPSTSLISSTEGIMRVATGLYVDLGRQYPTNIDAKVWSIGATAMSSLLKTPSVNLTDIVDATGLDPRRACKALFGPLNVCVEGREAWVPFSPLILHVQLALCIQFPVYYGSFPPKLVMTNICRALAFYTTLPIITSNPKGKNLYSTEYCVGLLVMILKEYADHVAEGHAWIIYGLQSDLLRLLIRSAEYSREIPKIEEYAIYVLDHVRMYSVYPPVMRRVLKDEMMMDNPHSTNVDMLSAWDRFTENFYYIYDLYQEFQARGTGKKPCMRPCMRPCRPCK